MKRFYFNLLAITKTPSTIKYKRRAIDIALGAFFPLTEQKRSYLTLEAGVNLGDLYSSLSAPNISPEIYYFNANTYKYYITPGFDYHFSPYLRVNFNTKLLLLNFGNIRTNYSDYNLSHTQLDYLYSNNIRTSESSLNFQFGSKRIDWIKINLGLHSAGFIEQKEYYNYNLKIRNIYWSAGFTLYPNFLFK